MLAPRVTFEIIYKDKNIASNVQGISWTENASGDADSLSLDIYDEAGAWLEEDAYAKGDSITVIRHLVNWRHIEEEIVERIGTFLIDDVSFGGHPLEVTVSALNVPKNTTFTDSTVRQTWQDVDLKQIAQTIADNNGMSLFFEGVGLPKIASVEESDVTDTDFLATQCSKYGYSYKMSGEG